LAVGVGTDDGGDDDDDDNPTVYAGFLPMVISVKYEECADGCGDCGATVSASFGG
jgi:hypothetical protein